MANNQNLRAYTSEQSREEAAKNGKKGGLASGEARRRRQHLREAVQSIFSDGTYKVDGEELTAEQAIALRLVQVAMNPEHKRWLDAVEVLMKITESDLTEEELALKDAQLEYQLRSVKENDE